MKNVSISLPEAVYRRARIKAAERNKSLSALVREILLHVAEEDSDFERRRKLEREVLGNVGRFRGGDRLSRNEVHRRHAAATERSARRTGTRASSPPA